MYVEIEHVRNAGVGSQITEVSLKLHSAETSDRDIINTVTRRCTIYVMLKFEKLHNVALNVNKYSVKLEINMDFVNI